MIIPDSPLKIMKPSWGPCSTLQSHIRLRIKALVSHAPRILLCLRESPSGLALCPQRLLIQRPVPMCWDLSDWPDSKEGWRAVHLDGLHHIGGSNSRPKHESAACAGFEPVPLLIVVDLQDEGG